MKQPSTTAPSLWVRVSSLSADRVIHFLALLAAFSALVSFSLAVLQAPGFAGNDHRLAPTFAVARGYRLYYGPQQGPVLSTIYGPITALAYVPSLLASTPMTAVRLGTIMSILLFFIPMLLVAGKDTANSDWRRRIYLLGLAAALTALSTSLEFSSEVIHADAPALAAGALACWFTAAAPQFAWRRAFAAGLFAAIAVMAKQNMLPVSVALALWWLFVSWRSALAYAAGAVSSMAIIWAGILAVSTSFEAAWFNWFQIPTHQPFDKAILFPAINYLERTLLLYLLLIASILWRYLQGLIAPPERRSSALRQSCIYGPVAGSFRRLSWAASKPVGAKTL